MRGVAHYFMEVFEREFFVRVLCMESLWNPFCSRLSEHPSLWDMPNDSS